MSADHNFVLIMAGGAGSRLWPMSRKALPKQFQPLFGQETLFQHMVRLASQVVPLERIIIFSIPEFHHLIREQVPALPSDNIVAEPALRDNGPASLLGMLEVERRDPDAVAAILWSDHLIQKEAVFIDMLRGAFTAASTHPDHLVTVGAKPTKPDPSLGYIQMGSEVSSEANVSVFHVKAFIEKPEQSKAEEFVRTWDYLWNVGYKLMPVRNFLEEFIRVQPEHQETVRQLREALAQGNMDYLRQTYELLPQMSIEYLFTQHLDQILVVPADIGWSDVGTWNTLYESLPHDAAGNVQQGRTVTTNVKNSLIVAQDKPVVMLDVEDLVVVDTPDALLIMNRETPAADLKKLVQENVANDNPELL